MINIKNEVYAAIKDICTNISDSYPTDWTTLPAIQYVEEDNKVVEFTDGKEQKTYVKYKIDIWHNESTSQTALLVDQGIAALGLKRIACGDVTDASGLKHKLIEYEATIDVNTLMVYQNY